MGFVWPDVEVRGLFRAHDHRAVARGARDPKVFVVVGLEHPLALVLLQPPLAQARAASAQRDRRAGGARTRWFSPPWAVQPETVRPSVPDTSSAVPPLTLVIL
jgi:hypothetical protein